MVWISSSSSVPRPTASSAVSPVMRSMAGFHDSTRCSGDTTKMPSEVSAMTSTNCACSRVSKKIRWFSSMT